MEELDRIREVYADRARQGLDARWAAGDAASRFIYAGRRRAVYQALARRGLLPLAGRDVIDVGCGDGGVLGEMVALGADPRRCAGVDLLPERIAAARRTWPPMRFECGDAAHLPWPAASFDVALQFTLLSSILDGELRDAIGRETMRVLRPTGTLLIYDFVWNPTNPDTRGVGARELRRLHPDREVHIRRVTLAPPLARLAVQVSPLVGRALEAVPVLRSHVLATVCRPAPRSA